MKLISNGFTGKEWIEHFEKKGITIYSYAKDLLLSNDFKPSKGVEYEIEFYEPTSILTFNEVCNQSGLELPPAEVACLLLDSPLYDKRWNVVAHVPITDRGGDTRVFRLAAYGTELTLIANNARSGERWSSDVRFVFLSRKSNLDTLALAIKTVKEAGYIISKQI